MRAGCTAVMQKHSAAPQGSGGGWGPGGTLEQLVAGLGLGLRQVASSVLRSIRPLSEAFVLCSLSFVSSVLCPPPLSLVLLTLLLAHLLVILLALLGRIHPRYHAPFPPQAEAERRALQG